MTDIEFTIKKACVKPTKHYSMYELVSSYMHGDAESFTSKKRFFNALNKQSIELLKLYIGAYGNFSYQHFFSLSDIKELAREYFKSIEIPDYEVIAELFADFFYEIDKTLPNLTQSAYFNGIRLFYWDKHGEKFEIEYEIK